MKELTGIQGLTLIAVISVTFLAGMCYGVYLESTAHEEAPCRKRRNDLIEKIMWAVCAASIVWKLRGMCS